MNLRTHESFGLVQAIPSGSVGPLFVLGQADSSWKGDAVTLCRE